MISFTSEEVLRGLYKTFGSYYNITGNGNVVSCRNVLDIYKMDFNVESCELYHYEPDVLFVMMNPGSSEPQLGNQILNINASSNISQRILGNSVIPAKPDKAQYQVMRVMKEKGLCHVRVINLSDLREANSKKFIKKVRSFEQTYSTDVHSVFSDLRKTELNRILEQIKNKPIVVAWGYDNQLIKLATKYIEHLPPENIRGISANLYSHASPQLQQDKEEWLNRIVGLL